MSHAALRTILPVAGWNTERARAVEITRVADPILPTPFRIGEADRRDRFVAASGDHHDRRQPGGKASR